MGYGRSTSERCCWAVGRADVHDLWVTPRTKSVTHHAGLFCYPSSRLLNRGSRSDSEQLARDLNDGERESGRIEATRGETEQALPGRCVVAGVPVKVPRSEERRPRYAQMVGHRVCLKQIAYED